MSNTSANRCLSWPPAIWLALALTNFQQAEPLVTKVLRSRANRPAAETNLSVCRRPQTATAHNAICIENAVVVFRFQAIVSLWTIDNTLLTVFYPCCEHNTYAACRRAEKSASGVPDGHRKCIQSNPFHACGSPVDKSSLPQFPGRRTAWSFRGILQTQEHGVARKIADCWK